MAKGVFDRVEIGTVEREEQLRAGGLDGGAHGSALVAAEVIRHDDVARLEFWDKDLVDIGLEGGAVDRPVERHRRDHSGQAQRADERRRLPGGISGR